MRTRSLLIILAIAIGIAGTPADAQAHPGALAKIWRLIGRPKPKPLVVNPASAVEAGSLTRVRVPIQTTGCTGPLGCPIPGVMAAVDQASVTASLKTIDRAAAMAAVEQLPTGLSPAETFDYNLQKAFQVLGIGPEEAKSLMIPDRVIVGEATIPLRDGSTEMWRFVRVQHDKSVPIKLGEDEVYIYKGGIRDHPDAVPIDGSQTIVAKTTTGETVELHWDISEPSAFARGMTYKNAALGEGGGAKGGITGRLEADGRPVQHPEEVIETRDEEVGRLLAPWIGPLKDVPAPDGGTGPANMRSFATGYRNATGDPNWRASFTGKALEDGGLPGRTEATGFGGMVALREMLKFNGESLAGQRIAVLGYGNVGRNFAEIAAGEDAIIVAAGDASGAIKNAAGLDVGAVGKFLDGQNTARPVLAGFGDGTAMTNEELIASQDVDILVTAALGPRKQANGVWTADINGTNAGNIGARYHIQLDNMGVTIRGDARMQAAGVKSLPDSHANVAGASGSFEEWRANLLPGYNPNKQEVLATLDARMTESQANIQRVAAQYNVDLRTATLIVGIQNIRAARLAQGQPLKTTTEYIYVSTSLNPPPLPN